MDEPLSNLDAHLRDEMRDLIQSLQRRFGLTTIFVTHDQEEALSMSDRVVVMRAGHVEQIGTPRDVYENPCNLFVAGFVGEINVFDAEVTEVPGDGRLVGQIEGRRITLPARNGGFAVGDALHVLLRPEDLRIEYLEDRPADKAGFFGRVRERSYTGKTIDTLIELDDGKQIRASEFFDEDDPDFDYGIDQPVWIDWIEGWEHIIRKGAL